MSVPTPQVRRGTPSAVDKGVVSGILMLVSINGESIGLETAVRRVLRGIRAEKGIEQNILAAGSGVSQRHISNLQNDRGRITIDDLDRICAALGEDPISVLRRAAAMSVDRFRRAPLTPASIVAIKAMRSAESKAARAALQRKRGLS